MNLKKILVALAIVAMLLPVSANAQALNLKWRLGMNEAGAEARSGERYPLPTQNIPLTAFTASSSFAVATLTAVLVPTLATNTRHIRIGTASGTINFGAAGVPTGTAWPFKISAGTPVEFNVATRTPAIYLRMQYGDATVYILED
jgi:hypothetical protein